jgi:hypothetical protein
MDKFLVIERDGLFYEGEMIRYDRGRDIDGKRITQDRVVIRGEGDWLKSAVEQRVSEKNEAEKEAA